MKHSHYFRLLGLCLLCGGMQTSCVDNDYDLDETDYTLGIETNITLPTCSTGEIFLRNFMDLEEDGVVQYIWDEQLKDSIFCVRQTGKADIDSIHVNEIRIKKPYVSGVDTIIYLNLGFNKQTTKIEEQSFRYDFTQDEVNYKIINATANNLSPNILHIVRGSVDDVTLTLNLYVEGLPSYIPIVHFDSLTLSYPIDVRVKKCFFRDKECSVDKGVITLTQKDENGIRVNDPIEIKLMMDGIQTGNNFIFNADNHSISFNGTIGLNGSFRIETSEIDWENYENEKEKHTKGNNKSHLAGLLPSSIAIRGNGTLDNDIVVKTFNGIISHKVSNVVPIKLENLPDFLKEEEVVLNLDNPIILFSTEHKIPATASTSIEIKSNTCEISVKTDEILVEEGFKQYYIADKKVNSLPEAYSEANRVSISGSITNLIHKIPKEIEVLISPITLYAQDVDIRRNHAINIDYEIYAPVIFGNDPQEDKTKLVYSYTEQGWSKELGELKKMNAELIELNGKIDSKLPAKCILTLIPLDKNGEEIKALDVNSVEVEGNTDNQDFKLTIKAANGHTLNDALAGKNGVNQLDGVKYSARLIGTDGEPLRRDARVRLHSMNVSVKGIVSYDAN